jgi:carbon storage regulator
MIGDDVEVIIVDVREDKVRLGVKNPVYIPVHRREIYDAIQREKSKTKADSELVFCCNGAYKPNTPGKNVYVKASEFGEKRLDCESLNAEGYCNFSNSTVSLKKCPLGIEKYLE